LPVEQIATSIKDFTGINIYAATTAASPHSLPAQSGAIFSRGRNRNRQRAAHAPYSAIE